MGPRLLAFPLAATLIAAAPNGRWEHVRSIGGEGDRLSSPAGISLGPAGLLYVADSGNNRIAVFDSTGALVSRIGFAGSGEGRFVRPDDVSAAEGLHIYVLDGGNERIQVFDRYEQFREVILSREEGTIGIPVGIEADPWGRLYVSDGEEDRVRVFRSFTGEEEFSIGGYGAASGRFREPADLAVDRSRRIWVCDRGNGRVEVFDALGAYLFSVGAGELSRPAGIAVDREGLVFVADPGHGRVALFDARGEAAGEVRALRGGGTLGAPRGVAVDDAGRLYVSDIESGLVHLFRRRPSPGTG